MTTAKFSYLFELDAATAEATAQRLAQIYQQQLSQIKIPLLGNSPESQVAVSAARAQQAQITNDARAGAQERINASRAESEERIQQARALSQASIEEEKRTTAAMQAEIREREQAQRQSQVNSSSFGHNVASFAGAAFAGPVGGLVGAVAGGNPFLAAGLAVNQGAQFLESANQMAVAYNRQNLAALQLAGSQDKLNQLMAVYDRDTGGVIEKAQEAADVTKLESLVFANSAKQLDEFTRAAKGISLAQNAPVSQEDEQLATAIITRRAGSLRELGLNADEVKAKVAQLQQADKSLSDTQAYGQAVLDTAIAKFGGLATSEAGAATGMERLGKAWADFQLSVGQSSSFNNLTGAAANSLNMLSYGPSGFTPDQMQAGIKTQQGNIQNRPMMSDAWRQTQGARSNDLSNLIQQSQDLGTRGAAGADKYNEALAQIYSTMQLVGSISDSQASQMAIIAEYYRRIGDTAQTASQDTREYADVAGGVITKQSALAAGYGTLQGAVDAYNASQSAANDTMAETAHWMQVISGGQRFVLNPTTGFGPAQDVQGPPDSYFKRQQALAQGIPLSLGGKNLLDDVAKVTQEQDRATEAANQKAAREWESTAKKTQQEFETAAKKMTDEFESKLGRIAGLTSPSAVTAEDMQLSKLGLYQNKPDEYLRQLMAKANDPTAKNLYPNVNFADAAKAVGMDGNADPKAIAASFQEAWSSGSLWADRGNIGKFLNVDAVQRELTQQRQGEQGQRNLLDYLSLDPRVVGAAGYSGVLPGRLLSANTTNPQDMAVMMQNAQGGQASLDSMMSAGLNAGAMPALQKFGGDAITTITQAMTGDQAQAQWTTLGTTIAGMMSNSIEAAIGHTDFVGVITAAVLQQINDAQDNQP